MEDWINEFTTEPQYYRELYCDVMYNIFRYKLRLNTGVQKLNKVAL